jgi:uncharacterized tellurite resistance protein B-like protein
MPLNQCPSYGLVLEGERLVVKSAPRNSFFDPRFLIAALLEHVARGDGVICDSEARAMIDLVADHFELDKSRAEQKFTHALALYSKNLDLATVGSLLRQILSPSEREEIVVMLLEVIAADGRQGSDELAALDEVADALAINPEERHAGFARYFEQQRRGGAARRIHFR